VEFVSRAKQRAKELLNQSILRPTASAAATAGAGASANQETDDRRCVPDFVAREELGYLGLHVQLVPSSDVPRPSHLFGGSSSGPRKRKRRWIPHRKHDGGGDHDDQSLPAQGGDPRTNLERRLEAQGVATWTTNQALSLLEEKTFRLTQNDATFLQDISVVGSSSAGTALDVHVAVWRRPFYVRGEYTKCRRDVSQSPFFVPEGGRVGVTSVEEQIVPSVARHCGGISTVNRDCLPDDGKPTSSSPPRTALSYGAAKFHASGREDTDVRMLLPPQPLSLDTADDAVKATGRPFVCEVIDALRVPTDSDLVAMRNEINHVTDCSASTAPEAATPALSPRYYGRNPLGVGVSSLRLVPASSFKRLQSETESKVKRYSCVCWSEDPIPASAGALEARLAGGNQQLLPLQIAQRTPVRVLHRRAPLVRTRRILTCKVAEVIDGHRFRLRLSTDAGTYVKEFVHGDLGRTVPSISSLLGCKTDILELDCEGVELGGSDNENCVKRSVHCSV
jgi:tRNA U54 and U55 pseudouridine synthase Pus10